MRTQPFKRADRVASEIQREIAQMLLDGALHDARLTGCTITQVTLSDDLKNGRVHFSLIGDEAAVREATKGFRRAAGFIRTEVTHRLRLRYAPELRFEFDPSLARAQHLTALIEAARAADREHETDEETDD